LDFVPLAVFQPLPLTRGPEPFSHPDWLFEVKYDGFRALCYTDPSGVRLVSRNGNRFSGFGDLCASPELFLKAQECSAGRRDCLPGWEWVCTFNELLFRHGTPQFCAFDLLSLNGKDLRDLPLIERKRSLRQLIQGLIRNEIAARNCGLTSENCIPMPDFGTTCRTTPFPLSTIPKEMCRTSPVRQGLAVEKKQPPKLRFAIEPSCS